jgi:hypothetical protein
MPGFMNPVPGRGFGGRGRGRAGGRGWRNRFHATGLAGWQRAAMGRPAFGGPAPYGYPGPVTAGYGPSTGGQQELDALKGQAEYLEDTLDGIRKRIEELEAKAQQT